MSTNAHTTHKLFFETLTRRRLNELLHRADKGTKYLENQLNERLQDIGSELTATSEVKKNKWNECSIYISFKKDDNEIGYISLHLMPEIKMNNSARKYGRLHSQNKRNRTVRQIVHITRLNEDSMKIKLVAYHAFASGQLKQILTFVLS
jgi:hypothetical protein